MSDIEVLVLITIIPSIASTLACAFVARAFGAGIEEIGLFIGPRAAGFRLANIQFRINYIPCGSYVKFKDFQKMHPVKRIVTRMSGCILLLLMAAIILGPASGFHSVASGFGQLINGAISPRTEGASLVISFNEFIKAHAYVASVGLFSAKLAAFDLLSSVPFDIARVWLSVTTAERLCMAQFLVSLAFMGCWLIAIFYFIKHLWIGA